MVFMDYLHKWEEERDNKVSSQEELDAVHLYVSSENPGIGWN